MRKKKKIRGKTKGELKRKAKTKAPHRKIDEGTWGKKSYRKRKEMA